MLNGDTGEKRANLIGFFASVAERSLALQNFNGLSEKKNIFLINKIKLLFVSNRIGCYSIRIIVTINCAQCVAARMVVGVR